MPGQKNSGNDKTGTKYEDVGRSWSQHEKDIYLHLMSSMCVWKIDNKKKQEFLLKLSPYTCSVV